MEVVDSQPRPSQSQVSQSETIDFEPRQTET